MKLTQSKKDKDLYYYFNTKKEKMWCYRYRYYDALGKRREKSKQGFISEKDALRALLEIKTNIINGEVKQVEKSNITVSEWFDIWYETHQNAWKITSQLQRKNAMKHYIKPLLGNYKLTTLDKSTYKRVFINELLKKLQPSTVQLYHRIFKVAINAAVDDEIIPRNRFQKISIVNEKKADNFYTAEELKQFLSIAKNRENITNFSLILLLSYTGVRKGEALGLTWDDINFKEKTVTVKRTRDNRGSRTPKTENSYRTILIDDSLIKQLNIYQKWCKEKKFAFGEKLRNNDFVFMSYRTGKPLTDTTVTNAINRVLEKSGLKKITAHGLRHTHATILISQRIPVKIIADRLGNTPQMILNVYGHSFKDLEEESVQAFEKALKL